MMHINVLNNNRGEGETSMITTIINHLTSNPINTNYPEFVKSVGWNVKEDGQKLKKKETKS